MIIAILKIIPLQAKRQEILDILLTVKGPVLSEEGCLSSCAFSEFDGDHFLLYVEQWQTMADFEKHVRGNNYSKILEAMELSSQVPEVSFYETKEEWGLDLIEKIRICAHAPGN